MVNPVPGRPISTPFGARGSWWSCRRDAAGQGIHTGADFAAPQGTVIVAARGGTVRHTSYGAAFGDRQFAIDTPDGSSDFYAHTDTRPEHGARVATGQQVARVGTRGNSSGPHLHFERHRPGTRAWSCDVMVDPQPSITFEEDDDMGLTPEDRDFIRTVVRNAVDNRTGPAVWNHRRDGWDGNAGTLLTRVQRIARRFLGPAGDPPDTTMLARIDANTRPAGSPAAASADDPPNLGAGPDTPKD
jgi:murein DD-endopeptidase MepM/ murein hydrolase activator NlpD